MKQPSLNRPEGDSGPWYRHFWPWVLIALPLATVVTASLITLWLALSHKDPLVIDAQQYDKLRNELRNQPPAPGTEEVDASPRADG
ncbi:MAG TPA: FixH family protein [Xanthomonadales bacterium]|nr:FixH family protein [Xanthomonadales bacterium]